jgi:AraC-like DNA-binding protein
VTSKIPLIRAAALRPFLRSLTTSGVPIDRAMHRAGLDAYPWERPEAPTPLSGMMEFVRTVAEREGLTDLGCRAFGDHTLSDFGVTGCVVAGSRTPGEALSRIERTMPYFCSHERMLLGRSGGDGVVYVNFSGELDRGGVHIAQQLTARLLTSLVPSSSGRPSLRRVEIMPWAASNLDDMKRWLCDEIVPSASGVLALHYSWDALCTPYATPLAVKGGHDPRPTSSPLLRESAALVDSVDTLIEELLGRGSPHIDDAAGAMRVSRRTLQRLLSEAGTSFRERLDAVRRRQALAEIEGSAESFANISASVGYANQTSFSRAVRRWKAQCPRDIRQRPEADPPDG